MTYVGILAFGIIVLFIGFCWVFDYMRIAYLRSIDRRLEFFQDVLKEYARLKLEAGDDE